MFKVKTLKLPGQKLTYLPTPQELGHTYNTPDREVFQWALFNEDNEEILSGETKAAYTEKGEGERGSVLSEEYVHLLEVAAAILGISFGHAEELARDNRNSSVQILLKHIHAEEAED